MNFTYKAYIDLLSLLKQNGYSVTDYHSYMHVEKPVILRHDVDDSLDKALDLARIEYSEGVRSTYFVLLSTDLYNIASKKSMDMIGEIQSLGHEIGLHFDEMKYEGSDCPVDELIRREAHIAEQIIGTPVRVVSMHRPSKETLEADYAIEGLINSYGMEFFKGFKYVSDSRRHWRENVEEIITSGRYSRLHILTHAFWYNEEESDIRTAISDFIEDGKQYRYEAVKDNITDLEGILNIDKSS